MELLDEVQMAACIAYSKLEGLAALPTLFFEFHGTPAGVAEQAGQAEEIAAGYDGLGLPGPPKQPPAPSFGRRGMTRYGRAWRGSRGTRGSRRMRSCRFPG